MIIIVRSCKLESMMMFSLTPQRYFLKSWKKFANHVESDMITINCQKSQTLDGYITRSWTDKCIDKTKH